MAVDIQKFFSVAQTKQFARDFLFRVKEISLAGGQTFNGESDLVYARSGKLPGRSIENKTVNYVGQVFNVPGKSTYDGSESYSIEFYHDEQIDLRKKFEDASRRVFDNVSSTGDYQMPGEGDYIILSVLDRQLEETATIKLVGASIRQVGEIQYDYADGSGEILKFSVTFAYHYYDKF